METKTLENPANQLTDPHSIAHRLESVSTHSGVRLVDLAQQSSVLLVFLRHAGCTFCREALGDIAKARHRIEASGTRIVLVHMDEYAGMDRLIHKYGLQDVERISDPEQTLYQAFGLRRGNLRELAGAKVWWRGLVAGIIQGHGRGPAVADFRQLPGVFFLDKGVIARRFRHRSAADRPEYEALCNARSTE